MAIRHDDEALSMLATALAAEMKMLGRRLVTAESCTGGWQGLYRSAGLLGMV